MTIMIPSEHPMHNRREKRPLLADTLPAFSTELRQLLEEQGELELAARVWALRFFAAFVVILVCIIVFTSLIDPVFRRILIGVLQH
jgi:hypothetical protein